MGGEGTVFLFENTLKISEQSMHRKVDYIQ